MAGYDVTRNALSAEQCKTLAPKVGDHRCIAVAAAVGALLGGKTEVPCKAARGPVRAHADRYADGSLVPDEVAVVYLAVSGESVLVLAPAGGGDEIRVALEPGLRVSWANSKFAHRVDCAPESTRIMLGPAARRGSGVEAVGDNSPDFPRTTMETPQQVRVFLTGNIMGSLRSNMSSPDPFDAGFLSQRGVPADVVAAFAEDLGKVPMSSGVERLCLLCPCCCGICIHLSIEQSKRAEYQRAMRRAVEAHAPAFANVGVQLALDEKCQGPAVKSPGGFLGLGAAQMDHWQGWGLVFTFPPNVAVMPPPPPGAQAMARPQTEMVPQRTMVVAVPPGTAPGAIISAQAPDGAVVQVTVPNPAPPQLTVAY